MRVVSVYLVCVCVCVTALLGALFVDGGMDPCRVLCEVCFFPRLQVSPHSTVNSWTIPLPDNFPPIILAIPDNSPPIYFATQTIHLPSFFHLVHFTSHLFSTLGIVREGNCLDTITVTKLIIH